MNAYVLAGGASSRMGSDKARLPHEGWPMGTMLCGRLEAAGFVATLVRRVPDDLPWVHPDGRPVPVLYEPDDGPRHPLRGVLAALDHAQTDVVVIPCDLPHLSVPSLRALADGPCVARTHPLVAHVPRSLRQSIADAVSGGGSARGVTGGLPPIDLPPSDLVDRNEGGGPWPSELLRDHLSWLDPRAADRVLRGERVRQRARGILDPSA